MASTAKTTLPDEPPNGVTGGIDWARDDHAVSIVDARGREFRRAAIERNVAGMRELLELLSRAGAREVAIERPDAPATATLRRTCRACKDLIVHRVALANQLRAHLRAVFPGVVGLCADLDSPIRLAFLTRFDCQDRADWLSVKRLADWLAAAGYCGRVDPAVLHGRLTGAPRGATGDEGTANAHVTRALVAVLIDVATQIKTLDAQIAVHADAHIFTSLPRSGTIHAARPLAEVGDCRARSPTPESLACLADVAPSTRQSGQVKHVGFRWAANKQLRNAVCDFAGDSRRANLWAADPYDRVIARGHHHPHAVRILARAWLYVIWHCWQDGAAYDPANHRALQTLLNQNQGRAA